MKRFVKTIVIAAAVVATLASIIVVVTGFSGPRLARGWMIAGAVFAGLGGLSFTGGTTQAGPFGGGAMGRGHELLAETHALGADGHARRQGADRAGRISFAWIAMASGVLVGAAGAVIDAAL